MPFYTVIVALLLSLSTNSYAGNLFDMLQRISDADHNQNYQGVFILRESDKLSALKVKHGNDEKGVWESLETLNGESQKVIRRNNEVVSIFPERELVTIKHRSDNYSLHLKLPENIDQLDLYYTLQRLEDDRVAGHLTLVLDLLPKDQYRYGYRYWVDKDTGMLLRCDLLAADKTVVEQMMFTSLEYSESPPVQPFEIAQFKQYKQQILDEQDIGVQPKAKWVVNVLPKGFMLTQSAMRHSQPSSASSEDLLHLVYSDGLASVSIFIEQNQGVDKHLQGGSSMGAVNAYGNSVGNYFVTVVGEVPVTTVQSMARSMVKLP
jgi:sigma-E factor negative regulatory protein RseB